MKKIFSFIVLVLFITSCSTQDIVNQTKKDFLIETKNLSEFSNDTYLEKTGKLDSSQDITLKSQASGRVSSLNVKEGDYVYSGEVLAVLEDSLGTYQISLQKAQNALDRAKINYDSTKITLDKTVFDSQVNLDTLEKNLQALKDNTIENIKLAETDLNNSDYTNLDSSSALELQKLDNTIEKLELDYQNKLISDEQTINSIYNTLKKEYSNSSIFMSDIIDFSDEILGITEINKDKNDDFEDYLGAKDIGAKTDAEDNLKRLINFKEDIFDELSVSQINTDSGILESLEIINNSYDYSRELLDNLELTLNSSIESEGTLSSTDISTYIAKINTYQTTMQANFSVFISFNTSSESFLNTYLNSQESTLRSIELTKKDREILEKSLSIGSTSAEASYNKTIISSNDSIDSLELKVKSAKNSLENSEKTREVTLRSLDNSINEARISYNQALNEYNKLTIKSPINGTISSVLIDLGQEVLSQTNLFEIKNNTNNEINISFNKKELDFVYENQEVLVEFDSNTYTGTIYSISQVADSNLKYISRISLSNTDLTGNIVSVKIPITSSNILLPIDIIKINNSGIGTLNILKNGQIQQIDVTLGEIYGDKIEIIGDFEEDLVIITSYVDNFDEEKYELKVK